MKAAHPSNLEFQVLSVLWASNGATVHDVWNALPDGKPRAYTTVLAVLQKLERKGHVRKKSQGRFNIYFPRKTRAVTVGRYLHDLVERVFHGRAADLIEQILSRVTLTPGETKAVAGLLRSPPPGRQTATQQHQPTMAVKKKTAAPAKKAAAPAKKAAAPAKKAAAPAPAKKAAAPAKKTLPAKKAAAPAPAKKAAAPAKKAAAPAKKAAAPAKKAAAPAPAKKAAAPAKKAAAPAKKAAAKKGK